MADQQVICESQSYAVILEVASNNFFKYLGSRVCFMEVVSWWLF